MAQALISAGFTADSTEVTVTAAVADATTILLYDDETKAELATGTTTGGEAVITLIDPLYAGQRLIAYITTFGSDTYGAVVVTESDTQLTGWKKPDTVDAVAYAAYLAAGGAELPDLYDPEECRNFSRDADFVSALLALPITFRLRTVETQAGGVTVTIEDITNALGGYLIRFDADAVGTATSKNYTVDGTYQVKIWGANQTEAEAITKEYTLVMPVAVTVFGTDIHDLQYRMDINNASMGSGLRPIDLTVYCDPAVVPQFQIDGLMAWTTGTLNTSTPTVREYKIIGYFIAEGLYTIRARRLSDGLDEISRDINIQF